MNKYLLKTLLMALLVTGCEGAILETPEITPTMEFIMEEQNTGNADVTYVRVVQNQDGTYTFYVTVSHPDTGWEDYADGWDVVKDDGTIIKPDPESPFTRLLLHPHVEEQPFTRSQNGIIIPEGTTRVIIRAHDLVDGYGGQEIIADLSQSSDPNFEVETTP